MKITTIALPGLPLLLVLASCSSGLGGSATAIDPKPKGAVEFSVHGLGIDIPDFPATAQTNWDSLAVANISVDEDTRTPLAFVAFTTDAPAGETWMDPFEDVTGTDSDSSTDVFLAVLDNGMISVPTGSGSTVPMPRSFDRALVHPFRHDRCTNCHGAANPASGPVFPQGHPGGDLTGGGEEKCSSCHNKAQAGDAFQVSAEDWHVPVGEAFDMRDRTVEELAEILDRTIEIEDHFFTDPRVLWAADNGNVPALNGVPAVSEEGNAGTSLQWDPSMDDRGQLPINSNTLLAQVRAWDLANRPTTTADSLRDITLVSHDLQASAGSGDSRQASIAWIPEPGFTPSVGAVAGHVRVAFTSNAGLIDGFDGNTQFDIYYTEVPVIVEPAGSGELAISFGTSTIQLVTSPNGTTSTGPGGDRPSGGPTVNAEPDRVLVAYRSNAENLVTLPGEGTPVPQIIVSRLDSSGGVVHSLFSQWDGLPGDGPSQNVSMSFDGRWLAFDSGATNASPLGAGEVYVCEISTDGAPIEDPVAVSRFASGVPVEDRVSRNPDMKITEDEEWVVVFESAVDGEDGQIYLVEQVTQGDPEAVLLSALGTEVGNGPSTEASLNAQATQVLFQSMASNLISDDGNDVEDIFLVDLEAGQGNLQPRRISEAGGGFGGGGSGSIRPRFASLREQNGAYASLSTVLLDTEAENLGSSPTTRGVLFFLGKDAPLVAGFRPVVAGGTSGVEEFDGRVYVLGDQPRMLTFESTTLGEPQRLTWNFGLADNLVVEAADELDLPVEATYEDPGLYTVGLLAERLDAEGGVIEDDLEVRSGLVAVVREVLPTIQDNVPDDLGDARVPFVVTFTDDNPHDVVSETNAEFHWEFEGGFAPEDTQLPAAPLTYEEPGQYTVTRTFSALPGQEGSGSTTFQIVPPPIVVNIEQDGTTITFTSGPLDYGFVWTFSGVYVGIETGDSVTLPNLPEGELHYSLEGTFASDFTYVEGPLTGTVQVDDGNFTFSWEASDSDPLEVTFTAPPGLAPYVWHVNGQDFTVQTNTYEHPFTSYDFHEVSVSADNGGQLGSPDAPVYTLSLHVLTGPGSLAQTLRVGDATTEASFTSNPDLHYEWTFGNGAASGPVTAATLEYIYPVDQAVVTYPARLRVIGGPTPIEEEVDVEINVDSFTDLFATYIAPANCAGCHSGAFGAPSPSFATALAAHDQMVGIQPIHCSNDFTYRVTRFLPLDSSFWSVIQPGGCNPSGTSNMDLTAPAIAAFEQWILQGAAK